jgi:hypothetical protein
MRLRIGILLCLFSVFAFVGCRKPLTPADNNLAPETWITSAPQDTITVKDKNGQPIPPTPGQIPVLYHVYWAGSDADGSIAGYYYAVVETLATAPGGLSLPTLPGPKPKDYRFTTRTDTTLIFDVSADAPDRQHAFFIYAVDNKGKPDPTPARFIFNAVDRYPPLVIIDDARSVANIWTQAGPGLPVVKVHYEKVITDTVNLHQVALKDTVPANGVLSFKWHAEPTLAGAAVTGYSYKLDETAFVQVDSSVHSVTYNSGVADHIAPGTKQFTLRAYDVAGGVRQTTRRFQMNISPITWISGPDPNAYPYTHQGRDTYIDLPNFQNVPSLTGSYLNKDSVQVLPSQRPERRTFFEIYKNRIYVRSEGDTVNMNSWIVLSSGGFDPDSPYSVVVSPIDPNLPDTTGLAPGSAIVMHPGADNGSPVGFKIQVATYLTPTGPTSTPSLSPLYPNFDPSSVQRLIIINGYYGMFQAGKAYAVAKAVDGFQSKTVGAQDDAIDNTLQTPQTLVEKVDGGGGTPQEIDLRKRIITFYVDKVPYLVPTDPSFTPLAQGQPGAPTVYPTRTLNVNLVGTDDDPYNPDISFKPNRIGGPSSSLLLRWTLSFTGKDINNQTVTYAPDFLKRLTSDGSGRLIQNNIVLDPKIIGPTVTLNIELCDCALCEDQAGSGRCVNFTIPFTVPPPPTPAQTFHSDHPGPGPSNAVSGSTQR